MTTASHPLAPAGGLPPLPLESWRATKDTLHLYVQIAGKLRLATTPLRNQWWNVPLYVDVRGLTTRRLLSDDLSFSIDFDFLDHELRVRTDRGDVDGFPLRDGLSVAEFHERLTGLLRGLGADVAIRAEPFGVPMTTPFADDREHASYDADAVVRWWRIVAWADWVLEGFAGWFCGKTSPVHLFWHGLDLAVTRFSGRSAPALPEADPVTREAYGEELISFGFWAGDDRIPEPAFYSYTAPEPDGLTEQPLQPGEAFWSESFGGHLALLRYEDVRAAAAPHETLLRFLQSAYDAGTTAAGWNADELRSSWCPRPGGLEVRIGR
jgi:hypothetical protein